MHKDHLKYSVPHLFASNNIAQYTGDSAEQLQAADIEDNDDVAYYRRIIWTANSYDENDNTSVVDLKLP